MTLPTGIRSVTSKSMDVLDITAKSHQIFHKGTSPKVGKNPDKVSFSYNVMYNAFKRLSKGYSAAERAALFHDTAARVYRINV